MVKKMFIMPVMMFGLLAQAQAQSISVQYHKKNIIPDHKELNSEEEWILEMIDNTSLYRPIEKIRDTSWIKKFQVQEEDYKAPVTHYTNHEVYYLDHKSKEKVTIHHFAGKDYWVKEPLAIMKWDIKNETKKINNYNCRLAISKKDGHLIEAWFTDEIPVSANPNGLTGLPGLILEYHISHSHLLVEKIDFDNKVSIHPPDWGKRLTKEEYAAVVEEEYKSPEGVTIIDTKNDDGTVSTRIIEVESSNSKKTKQ